uniref:Uncharacterized protein n=1 Tax=Chlamydomonas euryale TaxID=1486919 RepID=A0A7R9VAV6_9CHLO|mmetsp:Transcript_30055/g.89146  ORF Transcript_30055/g.89146 Transcript_30055/m.89146 type:complete len:156 (+) Transcript_30055:262-729(+)
MSAVERAGYFDSMAAAGLTESILKEKKIQRAYFQKQEAAGLITARPPPPAPQTQTALERFGVPDHVRAMAADPEQSIALNTSKNLMTSVPGYIVRDGPHMASSTHRAYAYDEEEVEFMKQQGFLDKTHNRRRDEFVTYVEAFAKQQNLMNAAKKV